MQSFTKLLKRHLLPSILPPLLMLSRTHLEQANSNGEKHVEIKD